MSRASTIWQKSKSSGKAGFDKLWGYADKLGDPVNRISNKIGSEAFWPTTLDKESEKAARILRSLCKDGFYQDGIYQTSNGPQAKQRILHCIPASVIQQAKGLAIFTAMRTGLWFSGAGGAGILVAKLPDGSWSPPSGLMLHTAGLGFLVGADIYDCVLVLNTDQALSSFSKWRCTVGGELSAVAGPAGVGGILETTVHERPAPVLSYLKSRGFYAGAQIDGTVVIERSDENERFYGQKISAKDILANKTPNRGMELRMLHATLKAAQGDRDADVSMVPSDPAPADFVVIEEGHLFGVPDKEDPDPYGVIALSKQGLLIKEASTHMPASTDHFDFKPSPKSPIYDTFRRSTDSGRSRGSSWRASQLSTTSTLRENKYVTSDMSTQTDFEPPVASPPSTAEQNEFGPASTHQEQLPTEDESPKRGPDNIQERHTTEVDVIGDRSDEEHPIIRADDSGEPAALQEVPQAPQQAQKARVVTVPKRFPPKLPPRNPERGRSSHSPSNSIASINASLQESIPSTTDKADLVDRPHTLAHQSLDGDNAVTPLHLPAVYAQAIEMTDSTDDEFVSGGSSDGSSSPHAIVDIATVATPNSTKSNTTYEPTVAGAADAKLDKGAPTHSSLSDRANGSSQNTKTHHANAPAHEASVEGSDGIASALPASADGVTSIKAVTSSGSSERGRISMAGLRSDLRLVEEEEDDDLRSRNPTKTKSEI